MFIEGVGAVHYAGDAALSAAAVALIYGAFGEYGNTAAGFSQMPCCGQSGKSAADDDMIKMFYFTELHNPEIPIEQLIYNNTIIIYINLSIKTRKKRSFFKKSAKNPLITADNRTNHVEFFSSGAIL